MKGNFYMLVLVGFLIINAIGLDIYFLHSLGKTQNQSEKSFVFGASGGVSDISAPNFSGQQKNQTASLWDNLGKTFQNIFSLNSNKADEFLLGDNAQILTTENSDELKDIDLKNTKEKEKISFCDFASEKSAKNSEIFFNKVAWMGNTESANNEWLELINNSEKEVSLAGFQIVSLLGNIKISFNSSDVLGVHQSYVLKRGKDFFGVPEANKIYNGRITNTKDGLKLFNQNCEIVDAVLADAGKTGSSWPAGNESKKIFMERNLNDLSWQDFGVEKNANITSQNYESKKITTPTTNVENTKEQQVVKAEVLNTKTETKIATPKPVIVQTDKNKETSPKILITEIKVGGETASDEFLELYNPNNEDVDLTDWYLQKKSGKALWFSTYAKSELFSEKVIPAKEYLIISNQVNASAVQADVVTNYSISDNNVFVLKDKIGAVIDKVGYGIVSDALGTPAENPAKGKSLARKFLNNNYSETQNNATDFEIRDCPTPRGKEKCPSVIVFNPVQVTQNQNSQNQTIQTNSNANNQAINNSTTTQNNSTTNTVATSTTLAVAQKAVSADHLVLSEVQLGSVNKTTDDFIEIYNPTSKRINLNGYRLVRRTEAGITDNLIKSWTSDVFVDPYGFFLWANSDYLDIKSVPNSTTTATLSADNGIALRLGPSDTGTIIDSLAWGKAKNIFIEGDVFKDNPPPGESLERKAYYGGACLSAVGEAELLGNSCDTGNNNFDFALRSTPNPQNSSEAEAVRAGIVIFGITTNLGNLNYFQTQ